MTVHSFKISSDNCRDSVLIGYQIDVETMIGFEPDRKGLSAWAQDIALDLVDNVVCHNELLAESVHIKVQDRENKILVDTIANRRTTDDA